MLRWAPKGFRAQQRPLARWDEELSSYIKHLLGIDADWTAVAQCATAGNICEGNSLMKLSSERLWPHPPPQRAPPPHRS
eukprot:5884560-Karenia_brevis.AAC.1